MHIRVRQAHNSSSVQMCGSCTGCMEVPIYMGAAALAVLAVLHVDALLCHSTVSNLAMDVQLDILSSLRHFQHYSTAYTLFCTRTGYVLLEHLFLRGQVNANRL